MMISKGIYSIARDVVRSLYHDLSRWIFLNINKHIHYIDKFPSNAHIPHFIYTN